MLEADYKKIEGMLPTPSHTQLLYPAYGDTIINLVYEIKHDLHTPKQYQWLSNIKLTWKRNIIVNYEYISEFYINEYTTSSGAIYTLGELEKVFKSNFIKYPKPYYPATTKELYQRLVWFAIRAYKKELLTLEIVYATALRMNKALERVDRLQDRELFKKAFMAYNFVLEHQDRFITKSKQELKKIKRENGIKRGKQKKQERDSNIKRVKAVMPSHIKPNGKPNITTISKKLKLSRVTVTKATKILLMMLLIFWIKGTLEFTQEYQTKALSLSRYTIIPSAYFTLFTKSLFKGFRRALKPQQIKKA